MADVFQIAGVVSLRDQAGKQLKELGLKAEAAGKKIGQSFDRAGARVDSFARRIDASRDVLDGVARGAAVLGAGITAAFGAVAFASANFEAAMQRVRAIGGLTQEQFEQMSEAARDMGRTTQFTATQSADALALLRRAGLSVAESIEALPGALELAAAGQLELADAADITAKVMRGMGLETEDLGRINEALVSTANNSNTSVAQMGQAMRKAAPLANTLGVSLEEVSAAIGILGNAGIQAEEAGTGLRQVMVRLINPTGNARKVLDALSQRVTGADFSFKSLTDTLELFEAGMASDAEILQVFEARAGSVFLSLANQGVPAFQALHKVINDSEGAAREAANTLLQGLAGSLTKLKSAAGEVLIAFGYNGGVLDALTAFTDVVTRAAVAVGEWINRNPGWTKAIAATTAAVGALSLAVAGLATAATAASAAFLAMSASTLPGMAVALKAVTGAAIATGLAIKAIPFVALAAAAAYVVVEFVKTSNAMYDVRREAERLGTTVDEVNRKFREGVRAMDEYIAADNLLSERASATGRALAEAASKGERLGLAVGETAEAAAAAIPSVDELRETVGGYNSELLESETLSKRAAAELFSLAAAMDRAAKAAAERFADAMRRVSEYVTLMEQAGRKQIELLRRGEAIGEAPTVPDIVTPEIEAPAAPPPPTLYRPGEDRTEQIARPFPNAPAADPGFWARLGKDIGDFSRASGSAIEGLTQSGIEALFGRDGLFGVTWEDRFKTISADFIRVISRSLGRELAGFAARGIKAIGGLIGGRGRTGALGRVGQQSDVALGGVQRLFKGVGTSALGADRELGGLQSTLRNLGGLPGLGGQVALEADIGGFGQKLKDAFRAIWKFFSDIGKAAWKAVATVGRTIWKVVEPAMQALWTAFAGLGKLAWQGLGAIAQGVLAGIKALFGPLWDAFAALGKLAWSGIRAIGEAIWPLLRGAAELFWSGVKALAQLAWAGIKAIATAIWPAIRAAGELAWAGIKTVGLAIWEAIKTAGTAIWGVIKPVAMAFWDALSTIGKAVWPAIRAAGIAIWDTVGSPLWSAVKAFWGALRKLGESVWDALAGRAAKSLVESFNGVSGDIPGLGGQPGAGAGGQPDTGNKRGGGVTGIISAVTGIGSLISDVITNVQTRTTNDRLAQITHWLSQAQTQRDQWGNHFSTIWLRLEQFLATSIPPAVTHGLLSAANDTRNRLLILRDAVVEANMLLMETLTLQGQLELAALSAEGAIAGSVRQQSVVTREQGSAVVSAIRASTSSISSAIASIDVRPVVNVNVSSPSPSRSTPSNTRSASTTRTASAGGTRRTQEDATDSLSRAVSRSVRRVA